MKENRIAVSFNHPSCQSQAELLSHELQLPLIADYLAEEKNNYDYLLIFTPDHLGIQKISDTKTAPFYIDFLSSQTRYRSERATTRNELLVRALGCRPQQRLTIVDATAGLGRDSFILASLGFQVIMLERSSLVFVLLRDALDRAKKHASMTDTINRLQLIHIDASSWLKEHQNIDSPDVVYLDPMFPERKKTAAVKKDMQLLQDLLGKEDEVEALLASALLSAKKRVVLKRPRLAPKIAAATINHSVTGKTSRFDIYLR